MKKPLKQNKLKTCLKFTLLILRVGLFVTSTFLTACASLNSDFECKMKPGVTCKSLDEINTMVDKEQLGSEDKATKSLWMPSAIYNSPTANNTFKPPLLNPTQPMTKPPLTIWVAPYEDNKGYWHSASTIYNN